MSAADLNETQVKRLQEAYAFFDKEGTGLGPSHVSNVLKLLGRKIGDSELKTAIAQVDTKKSGKVDFGDFLGCVASRELKEAAEGGIPGDKDKDLRDVFDAFDKSGSGQISSMNLRNALADLGEVTTGKSISKIHA
eukprot:TRINITY_DN1518_c0_g1_i1.p2 TRINITY_DN1518_c0_g1~~TRINITY_DN1518_c0_g1_i1.p2  ORF type:complete len:136 (-),score=29.15 TRINITY_DN1518_c0_g1_i1:468-875(-)